MVKKIILFSLLFVISSISMESLLEEIEVSLNRQLTQAVSHQDIEAVQTALAQGADPSSIPQLLCDVLEKRVTFSRGQEKERHEYEKNRTKIIDILIDDARTNLNCSNSQGDTPLIHFVRLNSRYDVEKLLKTGRVEINAINMHGQTALDFAQTKEMKDLLQKAGASSGSSIRSFRQPIQQQPLPLPLGIAPIPIPIAGKPGAKRVKPPAVGPVIKARKPAKPKAIPASPVFSASDFYKAIDEGNLDQVNRIIVNNLKLVNSVEREQFNMSPLHRAIHLNVLPVVRRLVQVPVLNINSKDENGLTPLMYAVANGSPEIVAELLKRTDILINALDNNGATALDYVAGIEARDQRDAIAIMLTNKGARSGADMRGYALGNRTRASIPAAAQPIVGHKRKEAEPGDK